MPLPVMMDSMQHRAQCPMIIFLRFTPLSEVHYQHDFNDPDKTCILFYDCAGYVPGV